MLKGIGKHLSGDSVNLRVKLESRDRVNGSRNFEVHIAERVLRAEDVGQRYVVITVFHEAHCDA